MSAKETGYKWSKFVWDDWRNDASLQSCDLATKGLWMDLLSLMFSSERQGYLQANNKPMSLLYLSKKTGVDKRTIEKKLKVLIENNVCSVDENGIVFSRRMARETCKSPVSVQDTSSKNTVSVQEGSRKVPVNLQEKNAENSQKQEPLIIEQNRIDIEKKVSNPPNPQPTRSAGEVIPIHTHNHFSNQILSLLMDHTNLSEQDCRERIEQWLAKTGNAQVVIDLVKAGIGKGNPISYISKCVENEAKKRISNPPELEKPASQFELFKQQYADDPMFQKLSGEEQYIAFMILKETKDWMLKYYKDHNPSSWKFYQHINQKQEKVA